MTREEWLEQAARALLVAFPRVLPEDVPALSVGHPARATRRVRLYDVARDAEGQAQVYVSPFLSDPGEVLAVLAYALCEVEATSRRNATTTRTRLGFVAGSAIVPDAFLMGRLTDIAATLAPYPHVYTDPNATAVRTQGTRMLKAECTGPGYDPMARISIPAPHDPYIVRLTRTQADRGMPRCGVCDTRMSLA